MIANWKSTNDETEEPLASCMISEAELLSQKDKVRNFICLALFFVDLSTIF